MKSINLTVSLPANRPCSSVCRCTCWPYRRAETCRPRRTTLPGSWQSVCASADRATVESGRLAVRRASFGWLWCRTCAQRSARGQDSAAIRIGRRASGRRRFSCRHPRRGWGCAFAPSLRRGRRRRRCWDGQQRRLAISGWVCYGRIENVWWVGWISTPLSSGSNETVSVVILRIGFYTDFRSNNYRMCTSWHRPASDAVGSGFWWHFAQRCACWWRWWRWCWWWSVGGRSCGNMRIVFGFGLEWGVEFVSRCDRMDCMWIGSFSI